jgi:hypothetical protein
MPPFPDCAVRQSFVPLCRRSVRCLNTDIKTAARLLFAPLAISGTIW